ncbi:hypothetical protein [Pseudofulvibacter geojedonensis]|uniref:Uncharacterized protein n=1 Tax=Pseudofulvibacter geojedonensis TaxID=1123758 RepID=A0ABW3I3Z9_9FLAO
MIASIFNKSKPINLVLAGLLVLISFLTNQILDLEVVDATTVGKLLFATAIVIFSIFAVDFIAKKNALSDQNSFIILLFALFFGFFEDALNNFNLVIANAFVLLALRKIISLKSELNTTKKIFDAALWIAVASLFHSVAIIYLLALYIGILLYASNYYKNWLVPIVSLFIVFVIASTGQLFFWGEISYFKEVSFQFLLNFNSFKNILLLALFVTLIIIGLFLLPVNVREKTKKNKSTYLLVSVILLVSVLLSFLSNTESLSILIFTYFPLSCILSVFLERLNNTIQSISIYVLMLIVLGINFL